MTDILQLKDKMRDEGLSPDWIDSKKKDSIRSYCVYQNDKPHPSPGRAKSKLKAWIEQGEPIGDCKDCGIIPNFAELIGLQETNESASPTFDQPTASPPSPPPPIEPIESAFEYVEIDQSQPEQKQKSTFVFGSEFCQQPPKSNSIIRGMLDYDSLAYSWGDSEAGKSFLMLDRDLHIANGMNWCGRKTKQGLVLYIAGEGKHGLIKRVKAWHEYHNLPVSNNIAFRTIPTALCDPRAVDDLVIEIKSIIAGLNRRPTLIELDTVNRNFGPGDENSTKDMTAFVAGMDSLRIASGAAVSAIHHCGHGDKSRSRGSIVLHNSVDFEYRISKEGDCLNDYVTTLEFVKVKDYDKPKPFSWKWKLQPLPWLDEDDDGNLVGMNSVVFIPTEYDNKNTSTHSRAEKIALEALRNALVSFGLESDGVVSVSEEQWRQEAYVLEISTASMEAKQKAFNRAKGSLLSDKSVCHHTGRYWIPANRTTGQTRT